MAELSEEFAAEYGVAPVRFLEDCLEVLAAHAWPGNVRELRNVVERCFILGSGRPVSSSWLSKTLSAGVTLTAFPPVSLREEKLRHAQDLIACNGGNKAAAARELGITRRTLYNRLRGARSSGLTDAAGGPSPPARP